LDLEIAVRLTSPLAELALRGDLDVGTAERMGRVVDQAVCWGSSLVAVDLGRVAFIDCAGIGALVEARHRLNGVSSHMWVTGLSPQVSRLMKLTGTDTLFGVSDLALHG
jgi:anti-anti-sigma factor